MLKLTKTKQNLAILFLISLNITLAARASRTESKPPNSDMSLDLLRIIVLDVSDSMDQSDSSGRTRLDTARKEMYETLAQLPPGCKTPVILIPFCNKVKNEFNRIYTNPDELKDAMDGLKPGGATNITAGLKTATEWADQFGLARNLVIYLYSDGEHNCGLYEDLLRQEAKLDRVFGMRNSKGLSQTVVVKRWGGVIGDIVSHLQKSPYVKVVDAGELELRTITLIPSATIKNLMWQDASAGLVSAEINVVVANRSRLKLPDKTFLKISCPLAGSQWQDTPCIEITGQLCSGTLRLLLRLNPDKLEPVKNYALPLLFSGPSQVRTDRGLLFLIINPYEITCEFPSSQLRPVVTIAASMSETEEPYWADPVKNIARWPMRLKLDTKTSPNAPWPEQLHLKIHSDDSNFTPPNVFVLRGQPVEANICLSKKLSLSEIQQGKTELRLQLAADRPKMLLLQSTNIALTANVKTPPIQITRISQQIISVGEPQWSDLTLGLVTMPVKLGILVDGPMAPRTVLDLVPCKDIVSIDGTPVPIRSGRQTVSLKLTGRVKTPESVVRWNVALQPPPPLYGIRYTEPQPVTVSFIAPGPVQVVLTDGKKVLNHYTYRGSKPQNTVGCYGFIQLAGRSLQADAASNLRFSGIMQNQLYSNGFSNANMANKVYWSIQPKDPATSTKWWHDVEVQGTLTVFPENAAPGAVLGSTINVNMIYEALYKKIVFYLAAGLCAVAAGTLLFYLILLNSKSHYNRRSF